MRFQEHCWVPSAAGDTRDQQRSGISASISKAPDVLFRLLTRPVDRFVGISRRSEMIEFRASAGVKGLPEKEGGARQLMGQPNPPRPRKGRCMRVDGMRWAGKPVRKGRGSGSGVPTSGTVNPSIRTSQSCPPAAEARACALPRGVPPGRAPTDAAAAAAAAAAVGEDPEGLLPPSTAACSSHDGSVRRMCSYQRHMAAFACAV